MTATRRLPQSIGPARRPLVAWLEDPAVVLAAAMVMALVAAVPLGPVRAVVNLPLVMLLPGHALLVALGAPDRGLELAVRLGARVVASLALVGLALLAVGSVVDLGWAVVVLTVWAVVVALGLVGMARARAASVAPPAVWTQSGVLLGVAGAITVALVVVGVAVLPSPREEPFSRLAVTDETQEAGTPLRIDTATAVVHLEVENGDDRSHRYGLVAAIDGGAQWESVTTRIPAEDTWTGTIEGRLPRDACVSRLRVSLTLDGEDAGVTPLILYLRNGRGSACS